MSKLYENGSLTGTFGKAAQYDEDARVKAEAADKQNFELNSMVNSQVADGLAAKRASYGEQLWNGADLGSMIDANPADGTTIIEAHEGNKLRGAQEEEQLRNSLAGQPLS